MFDILIELSGFEKIYKNYRLQEDLGLDSLGLVKMLLIFEDSFNIILDESDMNPFDFVTVNDVFMLMEKYNER